MGKLLVILTVALIFEAVGVVFLSKGLKEVGTLQAVNLMEIKRIVGVAISNSNFILGVFFEALFFLGLLVLMSKGDVSFIWPLTAVGYVLTTLSAKLFLHEQISWVRWAGVFLIMGGAALITWTETQKPKPGSAPPEQIIQRGNQA